MKSRVAVRFLEDVEIIDEWPALIANFKGFTLVDDKNYILSVI